MYFNFTHEQETFRKEVREFAQSALTPKLVDELQEQGEILNAHSPTIWK